MIGVILALISGVCMTLQGVFNTRLGDKIGIWETNAWVQGSAFFITLIICLIIGNGNINDIKSANKLYLSGGILGVIIIFTVMKGISSLGPTCAIGVILVAQLASAGIIDALGLFDSNKTPFGITKVIGVLLMAAGIIIFKYKCS